MFDDPDTAQRYQQLMAARIEFRAADHHLTRPDTSLTSQTTRRLYPRMVEPPFQPPQGRKFRHLLFGALIVIGIGWVMLHLMGCRREPASIADAVGDLDTQCDFKVETMLAAWAAHNCDFVSCGFENDRGNEEKRYDNPHCLDPLEQWSAKLSSGPERRSWERWIKINHQVSDTCQPERRAPRCTMVLSRPPDDLH